MARWVNAILTGLFLVGLYSSVYACDGAKKVKVVRHALEATPTVLVDVQMPGENGRMVRIAERSESCRSAHAVVRTAKMAKTLGRAFMTTVGAVMGTLVQVAVERTAAIV